jgi:hypothetical protein
VGWFLVAFFPFIFKEKHVLSGVWGTVYYQLRAGSNATIIYFLSLSLFPFLLMLLVVHTDARISFLLVSTYP